MANHNVLPTNNNQTPSSQPTHSRSDGCSASTPNRSDTKVSQAANNPSTPSHPVDRSIHHDTTGNSPSSLNGALSHVNQPPPEDQAAPFQGLVLNPNEMPGTLSVIRRTTVHAAH
ncbi:hypothetical protein EDC04DRAFT_2890730 [Pisolithus marmoratus]|nr:hypothetical protein EDC04DRAFT_2890730 [Pisolithus marmoratus]